MTAQAVKILWPRATAFSLALPLAASSSLCLHISATKWKWQQYPDPLLHSTEGCQTPSSDIFVYWGIEENVWFPLKSVPRFKWRFAMSVLKFESAEGFLVCKMTKSFLLQVEYKRIEAWHSVWDILCFAVLRLSELIASTSRIGNGSGIQGLASAVKSVAHSVVKQESGRLL